MNKRRVMWTPEEDHQLAQVWPTQGMKCASQFPRHSPGAVKVRSYKLGLRYVARPTKSMWSEIKPSRSCGSGQITPPSYAAQLCRERLKEMHK